VSGFNHTKRYHIGFVGSSSAPGWFKGNYTATYTVNGRTVYLNSWMNTSKAVYISDLVPDANGEIFLDFSTTPNAQWAFNSGIIIQEYTDANGGSILYMSNSVRDTSTVMRQDVLKLRMYPNPFSDVLNIDFKNTSGSNKVSAEVYDVNGRLIYRAEYNNMPAGANTFRINNFRNAMARGMFMVTIKVNGKIVHTQKMLRSSK
jgi:hypothetical protein